MNTPDFGQTMRNAIDAINHEAMEDLLEARHLLAKASEYMAINPWAAQEQLQDEINKFLEEQAHKEMVADLE